MDLTSVFWRALDKSGDIYLPYYFEGDWTDEEMMVISQAIDPHVPKRVNATFNNWGFFKGSKDHFMGKKATWDMLWSTYSVEELANKIADYYSK